MYDELIKRLRNDATAFVGFVGEDLRKAADAIEELSKYTKTMRQLKCEGWYLQQAKNHDGYQAVATMPLPEPPKEE